MSWPTTITKPSHILRTLALLTLPALLISCSPESEPAPAAAPELTATTMQVAEPENTASPEGEWGAYAANNGNTKYTDLDQIDASNVAGPGESPGEGPRSTAITLR